VKGDQVTFRLMNSLQHATTMTNRIPAKQELVCLPEGAGGGSAVWRTLRPARSSARLTPVDACLALFKAVLVPEFPVIGKNIVQFYKILSSAILPAIYFYF